MKIKICDDCGKKEKKLWILEAYDGEENYLPQTRELCKSCALKRLKGKEQGKGK